MFCMCMRTQQTQTVRGVAQQSVPQEYCDSVTKLRRYTHMSSLWHSHNHDACAFNIA